MHEVLVNRLGGLSLPRKSVVRLTDRPDMTLDVYRGRKTTMQCNATDQGKVVLAVDVLSAASKVSSQEHQAVVRLFVVASTWAFQDRL